MATTVATVPAMARAPRRANLLQRMARNKVSMVGLFGVTLILLIALIGPYLAPYDPTELSAARLRPPSAEHWMGTENFGRDVFSRFLHGSRISMFVGIGSVALALVVGALFGMLAGMNSGTIIDTLIMRGMDVILAFPLIVLVSVLAGVLGTRTIEVGPITINNIILVAFAISVVLIPIFARVARASVLAEVREDYVLAARSFGARTQDLLFGNLLPNIQAPLIVQAAFALAIAIAVEAAVSFLGLGVQPPEASWGTMLADARRYLLLGAWWLVVFPSIAIAIAVLSFNLVGDALRDALDPRARTIVGDSTTDQAVEREN
ncbi:MAG: ABC transporter permease [Dehalococcoidia bacterium]